VAYWRRQAYQDVTVTRIIAHLDMDAFFAAIEERDAPALRGLPLVVGADPRAGKGRGVVSTSNYQAREYGIHSATPISTAWRLSEAARRKGRQPVTFLSVDMNKYAAESKRVMAAVRRFVPIVEQASIDEAYGDLSFTGSYEAAETLCRTIKETIRSEERLTASVGVGPNKLIAKIASGMHKPDGLTVVRAEEAEAFLEPLSVRAIPGIGPKTEAALAKQGIRLVKDLKRLSLDRMNELFGQRGTDLYDKIRGRDESPVEEFWEPKSVGEQVTFDRDTLDSEFLFAELTTMCQDVMERLCREGFASFRTVVLTVRFADFETLSRSRTFSAPTGDVAVLKRETLKLLMPFLDQRSNPGRKLIRLLGVRVEKLERRDQGRSHAEDER
jgi:DNA polymerase IV (DinB-like DNA polymerase)